MKLRWTMGPLLLATLVPAADAAAAPQYFFSAYVGAYAQTAVKGADVPNHPVRLDIARAGKGIFSTTQNPYPVTDVNGNFAQYLLSIQVGDDPSAPATQAGDVATVTDTTTGVVLGRVTYLDGPSFDPTVCGTAKKITGQTVPGFKLTEFQGFVGPTGKPSPKTTISQTGDRFTVLQNINYKPGQGASATEARQVDQLAVTFARGYVNVPCEPDSPAFDDTGVAYGLLSRGKLPQTISAPFVGVVTQTLYLDNGAALPPKAGAKRVVALGSARATVEAEDAQPNGYVPNPAVKLTLKLSAAGKARVKQAQRLKLALVTTFRSKDGEERELPVTRFVAVDD